MNEIVTTPYIGNAKYCFSNSAAMLLASIGEDVSPNLIEVLTGTGLSATVIKQSEKLYFNNQCLEPDLGIKSALALLGFQTVSNAQKSQDNFPIEELKEVLTKSKAVLGPLNMGYLTYQPNHKYLMGADHFVLAISFQDNDILVHDPAEFPYSLLPVDDLKNAWMPNGLSSYKEGYYRYLANPIRIETISEDEIYQRAMKRFQEIYSKGINETDPNKFIRGKKAVEFIANKAKTRIEENEIGHYIYFLFPLAAKRANDFAYFFNGHNNKLSKNKEEQSKLLGYAHSFVIKKNWTRLSEILNHLANKEEEFEREILL